jgi:hypothetical protein
MVQRTKKFGGLEFDESALKLRPNFDARGHDSFGTFYKVLDWLQGKGEGTLRQYRSRAGVETGEALHDSVLSRFNAKPREKWPDTFLKEIKRQLKV